MKKMISVALSCAMVMSLAACGGGGSKPAETTAAAAVETTAVAADGGAEEKTEGAGDAASGDMGEELHFKLAENQPDGNPVTEGMKKICRAGQGIYRRHGQYRGLCQCGPL